MGIPHTRKLVAKIKGHDCLFDADTWNTPDPALTSLLNMVTANFPKTHATINAIATIVFRNLKFGDDACTIHFQAEARSNDLPPGAID